MDPNEITKVIDGVYKNILENFNPSSRQMIATGKAYLKSLHGASAACSLYLDALVKLSRQAQQSSLGCSSDIGSSLMQVTEVFKEIHTQQMNTLKAFYVDFLVPLETNLEKDTRVIQNEQKKFLFQQKQKYESYMKAASNAKKIRKKTKKSTSSTTIDKEIKIMQNLEEEKGNIELFYEKSLNEALTQERRRYGFILERQASLGKHYLAFYSKGNSLLGEKLENWLKTAKGRELLPESMQNTLLKRLQKGSEEDCIYCSTHRPPDDSVSISSQLRKTKSMEASQIINEDGPIGEMSKFEGHGNNGTVTLSRAKSDMNILKSNRNSTAHYDDHLPENFNNFRNSPNLNQGANGVDNISAQVRPNSIALSNEVPNYGMVKALYAYLSTGENQLCFLEGDIISLIGERSKGWQFGENLRTGKTGWFPVAYTEEPSESHAPLTPMRNFGSPTPPPLPNPPTTNIYAQAHAHKNYPHNEPHGQKNSNYAHHPGAHEGKNTHYGHIDAHAQKNYQQMNAHVQKNIHFKQGEASDSLHSSNDSGFSNDLNQQNLRVVPPTQPEVDYSEDELQNSNSNTLKSGDKWLMDRYQKSESDRIARENRSLSFINVSELTDNESYDESISTRSRSLERQKRNYKSHSMSAKRNPKNEIIVNYEPHRGPLKKLLSRTKSLIFKKNETEMNSENSNYGGPSKNIENQGSNMNQNDKNHVPKIGNNYVSSHHLHSFDAPIIEKNQKTDLWASHASLIDSNFSPPSDNFKETRRNNLVNSNQVKNNQVSVTKNQNKKNLPPIPPPLPIRSNNENEIIEIPAHAPSQKSKKSKNSTVTYGDYENESLVVKTRTQPESIVKKFSSAPTQNTKIVRVESLSGSEAPIVPNKINLRRKIGKYRSRNKTFLLSSKNSVNSESCEDEDENHEIIEQNESEIDYEDSELDNKSEIDEKIEKVEKFEKIKKQPPVPAVRTSSISPRKEIIAQNTGSQIEPIKKKNKSQSLRDSKKGENMGENSGRRLFKGSIRSEVHTVELVESCRSSKSSKLPLFDYGSQIHRRLYYPERSSKFDNKSERSGNLCGPWYDLWGLDPSVSLG